MSKFEITAESTPVYDTWGWDRGGYWYCNEWMDWFYALKSKYNHSRAKEEWLKAWNKQEFLAAPLQCYWRREGFLSFLKKEGLYDSVVSGLGKLGVGVEDLLGGVGSVASGVSEGVTKTSKTLKYVIPVALFLAVIGVSAYAYRTFVK
jgi:hypothetical protein